MSNCVLCAIPVGQMKTLEVDSVICIECATPLATNVLVDAIHDGKIDTETHLLTMVSASFTCPECGKISHKLRAPCGGSYAFDMASIKKSEGAEVERSG